MTVYKIDIDYKLYVQINSVWEIYEPTKELFFEPMENQQLPYYLTKP